MKLGIRDIFGQLLNFLFPRTENENAFLALSAESLVKNASPAAVLPHKDAKAVFSYGNKMVRQGIWLMKFKQNEKAVQIFAEILAQFLAEWLEDLARFDNFDMPILVFVPMSKKRQDERGGNHMEILAQKIIAIMPERYIELCASALIKVKDTKSQVEIAERTLRLKNLEGSIEADKSLVEAKNVVLLDDVITTGATIAECQRALCAAKAKRVIVMAIAH
jgi:ComF family protein